MTEKGLAVTAWALTTYIFRDPDGTGLEYIEGHYKTIEPNWNPGTYSANVARAALGALANAGKAVFEEGFGLYRPRNRTHQQPQIFAPTHGKLYRGEIRKSYVSGLSIQLPCQSL